MFDNQNELEEIKKSNILFIKRIYYFFNLK